MSTFKKITFLKMTTLLLVSLKKEYSAKATAVVFLISVSNCLFKSIKIFAQSLLEKKLQLFLSWQLFCFSINFFAARVGALNWHTK
jgi:hypothetical protein